jgi:hypothetical protein
MPPGNAGLRRCASGTDQLCTLPMAPRANSLLPSGEKVIWPGACRSCSCSASCSAVSSWTRLPPGSCHSTILLSVSAVATMPPRARATWTGPAACPVSVVAWAPPARFHTAALPSYRPMAAHAPSGLTARSETGPCPAGIVAASRPVRGSHTLSSHPLRWPAGPRRTSTSACRPGCQATSPAPGSGRVASSRPLGISQTRTLSPPATVSVTVAAASIVPSGENATEETGVVWPTRSGPAGPRVAVSQSRTRPSP